jgi:tetratricopeptide (TPR) repeat protein
VTKFSLFWILWMVTGNPLVAIVVLVVAFALLDRFALGLTPPWIKAWLRPGEASRLQAQVNANPHDKPARRALAELLVARRRYGRAVSVLSPAIAESARPESGTLLVAAEAYLGHGDLERAGACIEAAHAGARSTQYYALALLTGRILEASGRLLEAQEAYAEAVSLSQGRVEPRYRLYRVLKRTERPDEAETARRAAWRAYVEAPFFQQRQERLWAWRANPARPAMYAAVLCGVGLVLSTLRF